MNGPRGLHSLELSTVALLVAAALYFGLHLALSLYRDVGAFLAAVAR